MVDTLTEDLDLELPLDAVVDDEDEYTVVDDEDEYTVVDDASTLYVGSDTPEGAGRIFTDTPPGVGVVVGDDVVSQTGEEVVAQVTPKKEARTTPMEIARDIHRSLISNESWRKENPGAVEWSTFQKMVENEKATPADVLASLARQHNKGLRIDQLFHSLYWSTPENLAMTEGITRRRAATKETLYQIAENAGIPVSYVKKILAQGKNPNSLIAEFTGAEDVENMFDFFARAGKDAGRLLVEGGPGTWAAMQAAGATFKATTPLRTTPWGTAASVGLSGAAGIGTFYLGQSFMTTPLFNPFGEDFESPSEMLLGKKPQVTPDALPARVFGETVGYMGLLTKPTQKALAKIPEQIGAARVLTHLDRMNMNAWGRIKSYLFPGFKRTAQNIAEEMGRFARKGTPIPFTGGMQITGLPMNVSDMMIGASMAGGEAWAEYVDPGDVMTRITWGLGAGIANPLRMGLSLVGTAGPAAWAAARSAQRSLGKGAPSAREMQKGYNWLIDYAEQLGYTREQILGQIDRPGPWGIGPEGQGGLGPKGVMRTPEGKEVPLTLAQRTGFAPFVFLSRALKGETISPAARERLAELGVEGARAGPTLDAVMRNGEEAGLQALVQFMNLVRRTGTPDAIQKAAKIEQVIIQDVFQTAIQNRINRAAEAAARLGPREGAPSVRESGSKIYDVIKAAMEDARAYERKLYEEAGLALQRPVEATSLVETWNKLTADPYLAGEGIIPEFLAEFKGTSPITRWLKRRTDSPESEELTEGLKLAQNRVNKEAGRIDTLDSKLNRLKNSPPEVIAAVEDAVFTLNNSGFKRGDFKLTTESIEKALSEGDAAARSANREDLISTLAQAQGEFLAPLDIGVSAGSYLGAAQRKMAARLAESIKDRLAATSELSAARQRLAALKEEQGAAASLEEDLVSNVGELRAFRGEMLALEREATAAGKWTEARLYSGLAASALDDIGLKIEVVGPLEDAGLEALRRAHTFSKEFNNFFSRMYSQEVLQKTQLGSLRKSPELLAAEIFSSKSDPTALKIDQLFKAATFVGEAGEAAAKIRGKTLAGAYNNILEHYTDDVLRPINKPDGTQMKGPDGEDLFAVDPEARRQFSKAYGEILEMEGLGDLRELLKEDLSDITIKAITALTNKKGDFYKGLQAQAKYAEFYNATARNLEGGFGDAHESPSIAIAEAWASPNPVQSLTRLARQVKEGHIRIAGEDLTAPAIQTLDPTTHAAVKQGFRDAVFDVAWQKARRPDGSTDLNVLADVMFKPLAKNQKGVLHSAMGVLRKEGIVDRAFMARFQNLVRQWRTLQDVTRDTSKLEEAFAKGPSAVQELGLSLLGSTVGSEVASTVGKGTLIFQARAASFARDIFGKTPKLMVKRAVTDMLADPELFRMMSRKGVLPPSHVNRISRFFSKFLGTAMSPTAVEQYRKDYEKEMNRRRIEAARERGTPIEILRRLYPEQKDILRYAPPQPPPVSISSATQAAPPPVQTAAAPPPQAAPPVQMAAAASPPGGLTYDQVFPGDPISPLLEGRRDRQQRQQLAATQGLGSLA